MRHIVASAEPLPPEPGHCCSKIGTAVMRCGLVVETSAAVAKSLQEGDAFDGAPGEPNGSQVCPQCR